MVGPRATSARPQTSSKCRKGRGAPGIRKRRPPVDRYSVSGSLQTGRHVGPPSQRSVGRARSRTAEPETSVLDRFDQLPTMRWSRDHGKQVLPFEGPECHTVRWNRGQPRSLHRDAHFTRHRLERPGSPGQPGKPEGQEMRKGMSPKGHLADAYLKLPQLGAEVVAASQLDGKEPTPDNAWLPSLPWARTQAFQVGIPRWARSARSRRHQRSHNAQA